MPCHAPRPRPVRRPALPARTWCFLPVVALAFGAAPALAQTLAAKAKESGCVDTPRVVEGATYRCNTASGAAAYFNVPEPNAERQARRPPVAAGATAPAVPAAAAPVVPGLPRVDAATQKGRDDMRRRVLQDELATEEKLLLETRAAFANGAPPALAEEQKEPQRYAERIARLREAMQRHERNVEMLRRELGLPR